VVWKLDRLGSSIKELISTLVNLSEQGIGFKCLRDNIDTTVSEGKQVYKTFAALRTVMREKTTQDCVLPEPEDEKAADPKPLPLRR
jgi:DNA invertase Pin-like site-specific DNA recombinase